MRALRAGAVVAAFAAALAIAFYFLALPIRQAPAMDHNFDPASPVTKFFEELKRPWCAPGIDVCSCCGKSDAYPVEIDREASIDGEEQDGLAHVVDGSAIIYQDGQKRTPIANGTSFKFSGRDVTRLKQGNPTRSAWAFLGTDVTGAISIVWCVVPLPPSY